MSQELVNSAIQRFIEIGFGLILTIGSYLFYLIGDFIVQKIRVFKNNEHFPLLQDFAIIAVKAVEQLGLKQKILMTSAEKKAKAIEILQGWANAFKIPVNVTVLESLIEAALKDGLEKGLNSEPIIPPVPGSENTSDSVLSKDELPATKE